MPVIDISALMSPSGDDIGPDLPERKRCVAAHIRSACRDVGFFYVVEHGLPPCVEAELEECAKEFFARPLDEKRSIRMALGGPAWRGFFAVGEELTSGLPDQKEGLYLGTELPESHPLVLCGTPLHGANLYPADASGTRLRAAVDAYMAAATAVGQAVLRGISLSLELPETYIADRYTADPLVLFRLFHYPALDAASLTTSGEALWSVGEHTDYGLLTVLRQDDAGGLQVRAGFSMSMHPVPQYGVVGVAGQDPWGRVGGRAAPCRHPGHQHRGHARQDDGWWVLLMGTRAFNTCRIHRSSHAMGSLCDRLVSQHTPSCP